MGAGPMRTLGWFWVWIRPWLCPDLGWEQWAEGQVPGRGSADAAGVGQGRVGRSWRAGARARPRDLGTCCHPQRGHQGQQVAQE